MQINEPPLNFRALPQVRATVGGGEMIASGNAVLMPGRTLELQVANLVYVLRFESGADKKTGFRVEGQHPNGYTIVLTNFDNPLGTSLNPLQVGTVGEKKVWLSLFVEAPGASDGGPHVVSYSITWGGELG